MASKMIRQTSFTLGEVDIVNWKRTDLKSYLRSAQSLLNCEIITTGGAKKRKGTKLDLNITEYAEDHSQGYQFQDKNGNYYAVIAKDSAFDIFKIDGNGAVTFHQSVVTPYTSDELPVLDYTQINDVIIFAHNNHVPSRLYISDYASPTFAFASLDIYPQPVYDFNTINYNNFAVVYTIVGNILNFSFVGLGSDPGFTSAWIGGQIIGGGQTADAPIGYAIITAVSAYSAGTVTFTATVQSTMADTITAIGSQFSIKQPVFTDALKYPGSIVYYQNRLWLGNTPSLNNTIFGSKINAPINFDVGTGRDTDAIIYTIGESDSGMIVALNGGKQLEIYTQNYEFVCPQEQNVALTPSTFAIRQQSAYGSSINVKPLTYSNDSYYVNKEGTAILNFHFDGVGQAYTSTNVSIQSQHLVGNPNNRALLRGDESSQDNFIYYINNEEMPTITAFQFSELYKIAALTPVTFNSNSRPNNTVQLIDLFTINNTVYMIKKYTGTDEFTLEHFDPAVYMDCVQPITIGADGLVTGLTDLIGYTVQVVFNGQDYQDYLVNAEGEITVVGLPESTQAQLGLLYDVAIVPMYIYSGASETDYYKSISRIFVDYFQSLDFNVAGTLVPYQTFTRVQQGLPPIPTTDTAIVSLVNGWSRNSTFSITQSAPFPLTITSISYQIDSTII